MTLGRLSSEVESPACLARAEEKEPSVREQYHNGLPTDDDGQQAQQLSVCAQRNRHFYTARHTSRGYKSLYRLRQKRP
jgi:hypothetical protein